MKHLITLFLIFSVFTHNLSAQTSPAHDAGMYKILLPLYSEYTSVKIMGAFINVGTDTLRNVMINWTINDGPVQHLAKTGILLSRNQSWTFTVPEDLVLNKPGDVIMKFWVSMPNGVADEKNSNDTLMHTIQVVEKYPARTILIEEVTGAWCGYCPRAPIIYRAKVEPVYPNTIFTAIHSGDGMTISESRDFMNTFVTGIPTGFVDRRKSQTDAGIDFAPEDWITLLNKMDVRYTPVDLNVYNYYDPETRNWKIDVVSDFVFNMSGNFRMNCYVIEDSLYGTGSSWAQRNFFNGSASEPYLSLKGAGDPIPGYKHNHVVRKMLGGSWGQAGIIPLVVKKGDRYVFSQTFKADAKWKMENVHLVGIVQQWDQDKFKRPIINAVEGEVALMTGTGFQTAMQEFRVFPNPVTDIAWIEFNAETNSDYHFQLINSLGQIVMSRKAAYQPGPQRFSISMESLSPGIYFARLTTPEEVLIERLVKK